jgi:exopolyphosphatase/guanosine-5'-triphosphate,3'-diphosphate pyrophosphatase
MALHGNWVAIDPPGRVILASALSSTFGRERLHPRLEQLCSEDQLRRAHCWGVAMRLGQRLSGGVGAVLKRTSLSASNGAIQLHTRRGEEALVGEQVERRLLRLGEAMDREAAVVSG